MNGGSIIFATNGFTIENTNEGSKNHKRLQHKSCVLHQLKVVKRQLFFLQIYLK
jgi:hypothetical protein